MPGYRQWSDGDNLLPADIDGYLMGQTLMRFANAAARTAALPTPVAGMRSYLTDTGLDYVYAGGQWVPIFMFVKKAANETVTSSTTLQNDDHLLVALVPGSYRIEAWLHAQGVTGGDLRTAWTFSGTLTNTGRSCMGPTPSSADATNTAVRYNGYALSTEAVYGTEASLSAVAQEDLFVEVTAAGTLRLQWAQGTSNGTGTLLSTASRIYVSRLA